MPPEEDEIELTENELKVAKIGLDLMVGLIYSFAKDPETTQEAEKMIDEFEEMCELGPEDEGLMSMAMGTSDKLSGLIGDPE